MLSDHLTPWASADAAVVVCRVDLAVERPAWDVQEKVSDCHSLDSFSANDGLRRRHDGLLQQRLVKEYDCAQRVDNVGCDSRINTPGKIAMCSKWTRKMKISQPRGAKRTETIVGHGSEMTSLPHC